MLLYINIGFVKLNLTSSKESEIIKVIKHQQMIMKLHEISIKKLQILFAV
jgi:hypothetical protein